MNPTLYRTPFPIINLKNANTGVRTFQLHFYGTDNMEPPDTGHERRQGRPRLLQVQLLISHWSNLKDY